MGISGACNDLRRPLEGGELGARLAVDYFVYRAGKEIAALRGPYHGGR